MHFQNPIPGWTTILNSIPDRSIIKSVSNPSLLREAKEVYKSIGRNPENILTDYRHYDFVYPFDRVYSFSELKVIWDSNFRRFIDKTYLERYAPYIDMVEELNEYYDSRMAVDKKLLAPYLLSAQAAVDVWNNSFRGKTVRSADGGEGLIPDGCRLVIGNSPVGNDIPKEFFRLAIDSDNILGYHPYTKYLNKKRDPGDWIFHCGRWNTNERDYGLKPRWAFTECGPYLDAARGWRHPDVLDGDEALLVQAMRVYLTSISSTLAYQEGRIIGPGCYFTSGDPVNWPWYDLRTSQLIQLADIARIIWKPGVDMSNPDVDLIRMHANEILKACDRLDPPVPKHTMSDKTNQQVINLFNGVLGGYDELTRAIPSWPTTMAGSPAVRAQLYTGPAIEDMNLTDIEKQRLIANL